MRALPLASLHCFSPGKFRHSLPLCRKHSAEQDGAVESVNRKPKASLSRIKELASRPGLTSEAFSEARSAAGLTPLRQETLQAFQQTPPPLRKTGKTKPEDQEKEAKEPKENRTVWEWVADNLGPLMGGATILLSLLAVLVARNERQRNVAMRNMIASAPPELKAAVEQTLRQISVLHPTSRKQLREIVALAKNDPARFEQRLREHAASMDPSNPRRVRIEEILRRTGKQPLELVTPRGAPRLAASPTETAAHDFIRAVEELAERVPEIKEAIAGVERRPTTIDQRTGSEVRASMIARRIWTAILEHKINPAQALRGNELASIPAFLDLHTPELSGADRVKAEAIVAAGWKRPRESRERVPEHGWNRVHFGDGHGNSESMAEQIERSGVARFDANGRPILDNRTRNVSFMGDLTADRHMGDPTEEGWARRQGGGIQIMSWVHDLRTQAEQRGGTVEWFVGNHDGWSLGYLIGEWHEFPGDEVARLNMLSGDSGQMQGAGILDFGRFLNADNPLRAEIVSFLSDPNAVHLARGDTARIEAGGALLERMMENDSNRQEILRNMRAHPEGRRALEELAKGKLVMIEVEGGRLKIRCHTWLMSHMANRLAQLIDTGMSPAQAADKINADFESSLDRAFNGDKEAAKAAAKDMRDFASTNNRPNDRRLENYGGEEVGKNVGGIVRLVEAAKSRGMGITEVEIAYGHDSSGPQKEIISGLEAKGIILKGVPTDKEYGKNPPLPSLPNSVDPWKRWGVNPSVVGVNNRGEVFERSAAFAEGANILAHPWEPEVREVSPSEQLIDTFRAIPRDIIDLSHVEQTSRRVKLTDTHEEQDRKKREANLRDYVNQLGQALEKDVSLKERLETAGVLAPLIEAMGKWDVSGDHSLAENVNGLLALLKPTAQQVTLPGLPPRPPRVGNIVLFMDPIMKVLDAIATAPIEEKSRLIAELAANKVLESYNTELAMLAEGESEKNTVRGNVARAVVAEIKRATESIPHNEAVTLTENQERDVLNALDEWVRAVRDNPEKAAANRANYDNRLYEAGGSQDSALVMQHLFDQGKLTPEQIEAGKVLAYQWNPVVPGVAEAPTTVAETPGTHAWNEGTQEWRTMSLSLPPSVSLLERINAEFQRVQTREAEMIRVSDEKQVERRIGFAVEDAMAAWISERSNTNERPETTADHVEMFCHEVRIKNTDLGKQAEIAWETMQDASRLLERVRAGEQNGGLANATERVRSRMQMMIIRELDAIPVSAPTEEQARAVELRRMYNTIEHVQMRLRMELAFNRTGAEEVIGHFSRYLGTLNLQPGTLGGDFAIRMRQTEANLERGGTTNGDAFHQAAAHSFESVLIEHLARDGRHVRDATAFLAQLESTSTLPIETVQAMRSSLQRMEALTARMASRLKEANAEKRQAAIVGLIAEFGPSPSDHTLALRTLERIGTIVPELGERAREAVAALQPAEQKGTAPLALPVAELQGSNINREAMMRKLGEARLTAIRQARIAAEIVNNPSAREVWLNELRAIGEGKEPSADEATQKAARKIVNLVGQRLVSPASGKAQDRTGKRGDNPDSGQKNKDLPSSVDENSGNTANTGNFSTGSGGRGGGRPDGRADENTNYGSRTKIRK